MAHRSSVILIVLCDKLDDFDLGHDLPLNAQKHGLYRVTCLVNCVDQNLRVRATGRAEHSEVVVIRPIVDSSLYDFCELHGAQVENVAPTVASLASKQQDLASAERHHEECVDPSRCPQFQRLPSKASLQSSSDEPGISESLDRVKHSTVATFASANVDGVTDHDAAMRVSRLVHGRSLSPLVQADLVAEDFSCGLPLLLDYLPTGDHDHCFIDCEKTQFMSLAEHGISQPSSRHARAGQTT